uniref:Fibronectin type-III domain-containing protein n=1 Tax=Ciona savignyi TaxID=51511 RepID=H2ZN06_CIOSA
MSGGVPSNEPYTVTFTTTPSPPLTLRVTNVTSNSIDLRWRQPTTLTEGRTVQYRIEYTDMLSTSGERMTELITVHSPDSLVNVRLQRLESGVTYKFNITTILNGVPSVQQAQVMRSTIPSYPVISRLTKEDNGIHVSFAQPKVGSCPYVKVFYSPGVNGTVRPVYGNITDGIFLLGAPLDPAYFIHARCVTNDIEGPQITIRASQNSLVPGPRDFVSQALFVAKPLICIIAGLGQHLIPNSVKPDECCGARPYYSGTHSCCGRNIIAIGRRRCCDRMAYVHHACQICRQGEIVNPCRREN